MSKLRYTVWFIFLLYFPFCFGNSIFLRFLGEYVGLKGDDEENQYEQFIRHDIMILLNYIFSCNVLSADGLPNKVAEIVSALSSQCVSWDILEGAGH